MGFFYLANRFLLRPRRKVPRSASSASADSTAVACRIVLQMNIPRTESKIDVASRSLGLPFSSVGRCAGLNTNFSTIRTALFSGAADQVTPPSSRTPGICHKDAAEFGQSECMGESPEMSTDCTTVFIKRSNQGLLRADSMRSRGMEPTGCRSGVSLTSQALGAVSVEAPVAEDPHFDDS